MASRRLAEGEYGSELGGGSGRFQCEDCAERKRLCTHLRPAARWTDEDELAERRREAEAARRDQRST
jgi:hypothetical protein